VQERPLSKGENRAFTVRPRGMHEQPGAAKEKVNKISLLLRRRPSGDRRAADPECASRSGPACGAVPQRVCNIYRGAFPHDAPDGRAECSKIPRLCGGDFIAACQAMP
jgi:hypothetical protein